MMPDCSFEELISIFSTRYSGDHLWLRPAMKRCGISRQGSQITPGEFTTHDRASSHYNHLSNPSFMYCRTYVNLYDAVRSVIPCDKLHKHQFSFNNDGEQHASFGWDREFQYGGNFSVSWDRKSTSGLLRNFSRTHGTMPPINFPVEMKACFCRIKRLTSNIRHNINNFHLMWESTFPTGAWALKAWAVFPRPVGVTIRGNLIGLPLLRVVNNSDRWMRKAWEWREASHVVQTRFGTSQR